MDITATSAVRAYAQALGRAGEAGPDSADIGTPAPSGGPSFANMVKDVVETTANGLATSEAATIQAVTGKNADLLDVVTAATNAELTLQTVVATRDKIIQAYQDIMQMPI